MEPGRQSTRARRGRRVSNASIQRGGYNASGKLQLPLSVIVGRLCQTPPPHGRGCGVGRTLGTGVPRGVGVGRGVEVAVGVGVGIGVAQGVSVYVRD
jgi:hypothetical protein